MKVVFRADASEQMGTGHVMRCLTLADELQKHGAEIAFICRELPGHLCDYVENIRGYRVHRLPLLAKLGLEQETDAERTKSFLDGEKLMCDWLVVDHYSLDSRWEQCLRETTNRLMVIDDLADRPHDCDLLLDPNYYEYMDKRYKDLVPLQAVCLLGSEYALLREEFSESRKIQRVRDGSVKRLLIFFGGTDPTNETGKALRAVQLLKWNEITVDVVVGSRNPNRHQIEALCLTIPHVNYYCQIDHIADLMSKADISIGACGTTAWERCFLGLPAITITIGANQIEVAKALDKVGAVMNLGWHNAVTAEMITDQISRLLQEPERLKVMSNIGLALVCDGLREIVHMIKNWKGTISESGVNFLG